MKLSVVIPVYGCCASLDALYERLEKTLSSITDDFEIIMVNDASPDLAWAKIQKLSELDNKVKGINFSKNFGQHKAIAAGLDYADGDWVIVMDCDLQDQPEEILKLYAEAMNGYEVVFGRRVDRQDTYFKRLGSKVFYWIYNYFTESNANGQIGNFSIVSKKVVHELRKITERNRPYALLVNWLGFSRSDIDIEHDIRSEGKSSYTFNKLLSLASDIIIAYSNKPLKLSINLGFILSTFAFLYALWLVVSYYYFDITVEGWTSVIVSIFFIGGLIISNLGILGIYIGRIYDEVKNRPYYIIENTTFDKENL